jgi:hypothetical protein
MSTAAAPALSGPSADNPSPKPKLQITLTRGGAYLLEGVVQSEKVFPEAHDSGKGFKLRKLLRQQNPARTADIDFEKIELYKPNDLDEAKRKVAWDEAWAAWRKETVTIELTVKQRDLAQKGLRAAFKNRVAWGLLPQNDEHVASLIEGFDLGSEDETE